ncbi:MAG: type II toxin-antitoxin system Phd/YefM family antitoxin [Spirochaetota bacterium]|nr:type II toxin-antitoxin system Phd/YefM family antitoxin [Spirochaetota bacterium]
MIARLARQKVCIINNSNIWQLQNAKNKLSELINIASEGKPQLITKNGKPSVYVIKADL